MRRYLFPFALVFLGLFMPGCYDSNQDEDTSTDADVDPDRPDDPPPDELSEDIPEGELCDPVLLDIMDVYYSPRIAPMTDTEIVIHHAQGTYSDLESSMEGNIIYIDISGYSWDLCHASEPSCCPSGGNYEGYKVHLQEGLPPGDYILRINGTDYSLTVYGTDCETQDTAITNVEYDDYIPPVERTPDFIIQSSGRSCDCNGATAVMQRVTSSPAEIWIDVTEVICDPSQCCNECPCIDAYENTVFVYLPWDNIPMYTVHINGNEYTLHVFMPAE
jgi:hypothetical protein